jgi:hypothetical protein
MRKEAVTFLKKSNQKTFFKFGPGVFQTPRIKFAKVFAALFSKSAYLRLP